MIVGVVGLKGSGKDTLANVLISQFGYRRDSFAAPLKDAVAAIFGWPRDLLEGNTKESRAWREQPHEFWSDKLGRTITPRRVLQEMGTEVMRESFHENIWVDSFAYRNSDAEKVVISDVRFTNEMEAIKALGGILVRVKRGPDPSYLNTVYSNPDMVSVTQDGASVHKSEWEWATNLDLIDHTIDNDGTLQEFTDKVSDFCKDELGLSNSYKIAITESGIRRTD